MNAITYIEMLDAHIAKNKRHAKIAFIVAQIGLGVSIVCIVAGAFMSV